MMRTGKKLLAIFLVLGILFSMLTVLPAAAEGEEEVIESLEIEPISVMEGTNGYWDRDWNPETDEYDLEYFRYYTNAVSDNMKYTITFKDGSDPIEGTGGYFEYDGEEYGFDVETNQSYENQWTAGNTFQVTVSVLGKSVQVPVTITESPIESITVEPISIIERTNGYWQNDWNPETDEWDLQYFRYETNAISNNLNYTISFKDGSEPISGTDDYVTYDGEEYGFDVETNQSYENQWIAGNTYQATVSVLGKSVPVSVTITETPIESITIKPISIIEGTNGYWDRDWNPETDEYDLRYYRYNFYDKLSYTITFNDGTKPISGIGDYCKYDGKEYWFTVDTDQSYENQWTVGNTYQATVSAMGKSAQVPVTITPSPIQSIEIEPISIFEHTHGYWNEVWNPETDEYDLEYFRYSLYENVNYTVTLKDGTVLKGSEDGIRYNGERYYFNYDIDQSYENQWTAGNTYQVEFSIMGKTVSAPVTIQAFPATKIEIIRAKETGDISGWYDDDHPIYKVPLFTCRITLEDGTTMVKYSDSADDIGLHVTDQQRKTPWTVGGENTVTVSIGKVSTTFSAVLGTTGYTYLEQDGGIFITGCSLTDEVLDIPSVIDGKPVKGIMELYAALRFAKKINIPDSVTYLSEYAFYNWQSSLESLSIGKGVTDLDVYKLTGFFSSRKLKNVDISADNPYYKSIDGVVYNKAGDTVVFYPAAKGNTFVVPDAVNNVDIFYQYKDGLYADINLQFSENSNACFVEEDGVTYNKAKTRVIACDPKKTGEYIMPDSVISITDGAFAGSSLSHVKVSDNVTDIVYQCFAGCGEMTIDLPANLQKISQLAFEGSRITSISLPDSLKKIDGGAFEYSALQEITIPGSVQVIESGAFVNCGNLKKVAIMDNTGMTIGDAAFYDCPKLSDLTLGQGIQSIGSSAFYATAIESVTIPGSVKTIGDDAFRGSLISKLTMEKGVSAIGSFAFAGNPLTGVSLPESVTTVAYGAFEWCQNIETVQLPTGIRKISNRAFHGSGWFESLQDGYAGNILFYGANADFNLGATDTKIDVKPGTTVIADMAFQNMSTLKEVTLPKGLLTIGNLAFFDCSSIETITIPATVSNIAPDAFTECTSLKAIQVDPNNPYYCSVDGVLFNKDKTELIVCPKRVNKIYTVPYSVKNIKEYAFGLSGIEKLIIANDAKLEKFSLNATLTERDFGSQAYNGQYPRDEYDRFLITVACLQDSHAYRYALDNLLDVEILNEYTITYKLDGGKNNAANPTKYTSAGAEIVLQNPTRSGYTFKGWYSDSKLTKKVTKIAAGSTGNKTFYAKWAKAYTITYKLNSGTNNKSNPKTYTKIDATITLKNPTRKGYTFKGWYSDSKYKKKVTKIAKGSTGNKTLYAKWAKNTYKITYKLNKGKNSAKNPKTYTVTTKTIILKNPTRKGYTFQGWYSDSKYKTKVTKITKGSTGNKTLYAKWKKK